MTTTCHKCNKNDTTNTHNEIRLKYIFGHYLCKSCIPDTFATEFKQDNTPIHHEIKHSLVDYFCGLFIHTGILIGDTIVLIPDNSVINIILSTFMKETHLLHHIPERRMYITRHEQLLAGIARFQDNITISRKENPAFYRAIVDCNYKGDKNSLVLSYNKSILSTFPDTMYTEVTNDVMSKVYRSIQLIELLGEVYDPVIEYHAMLEYMNDKYPARTDYDSLASQSEIADANILQRYKNKIAFYIPDMMAMFAKTVQPGTIIFVKTSQEAVIPTKAHPTDSGFDVTITKHIWTRGIYSKYDTDIIAIPSQGTYTMLVARSSIYETGYSMVNAVGIIDTSYRGTLKVILRRDFGDKPLNLPCCILQLVPMVASYTVGFEISSPDLTTRGDGGFGSTNQIKIDQTKQPEQEQTNPINKKEEEIQKYEHVGC